MREQARPAVIRESPRAPWLAVSAVCFGAFMGPLDASIVTITFPAMEHDFGVPVAAVQWVSLVYLAWHLDTQSYQAGNTGYSGTEQARGRPIGPGEADPSGAFH